MKDELELLTVAQREAGKLEVVSSEVKHPGWKNDLVVLSGTLSIVTNKRRAAPPRIPQPSSETVGAIAIAATLMGMGSQAQAMVNSMDESDWKNAADWVEFDMDGNHFEGVLWMMPMRTGEKVKVVAEKTGENCYFAYAVQRESDAVVAIYPYALMGTKARSRFEQSGTFWFFTIIAMFMTIMLGIQAASRGASLRDTLPLIGMEICGIGVMMILVYSLGKWKFRNSIEDELAESIFQAFGWPDPKNSTYCKYLDGQIEKTRNQIAHCPTHTGISIDAISGMTNLNKLIMV